MARTEEDIIARAGIEVTLGGVVYTIPPLVIRESREWKRKAIKLVAPLPEITTINSDDAEGFQKALETLLVTMPDEIIDLFFAYAKELDREDIESKATDAELAKAFGEVLAVAFPLSQAAPNLLRAMSRPEST